MKTKVLIYGTGYFSKKFMDECFNREEADVLAFIESSKSKNEFYDTIVIEGKEISNYQYDLIIVISGYITQIKENLIKYKVNPDNCIYTSDIHNWMIDKEKIPCFLNILKNNYIQNKLKLVVENQVISSYAVTETYDGLVFIGNYADDLIGEMIDTGNVYSYDEIDAFLDLSDKFYNINKEGYFFDCGCNILTTSIYVLNRNKKLKAIGFEPVKRTWKIAKANAALNNMEERITIVNTALSDYKGISQIKCSQYSCGGAYIVGSDINDNNLEEIGTISLDEWIVENKFDINKISYLWIDTEGYEGYVIRGMMKFLKQKKIPMYLEYYTDFLIRSGCKEILLDCLENVYSKYIIVKRGGYMIYQNYIILKN